MKIVFLGDIVGEYGLLALQNNIEQIRTKYQPDCIIANGENTTNNAGLSYVDYKKLKLLGINVITNGNHYKKFTSIRKAMQQYPDCIRPANYDDDFGCGITKYKAIDGKQLVVINIILQRYMPDQVASPFKHMQEIIKNYRINDSHIDGIIVDAHGACGFEKKSLAYFLDGKITAFIGTHTHIQTNDLSILPNGTLYLTDAGMCGAYNYCTGTHPHSAIQSFTVSNTTVNPEAKIGLNGVYLEIQDKVVKESILINNFSY